MNSSALAIQAAALYRWEFERHGEAMRIDVPGLSHSMSPTRWRKRAAPV
jgi:hypothetical protein